MIKLLSIEASNDVIQYWIGQGYEVRFIFNVESTVIRPKLSNPEDTQVILDPELVGAA